MHSIDRLRREHTAIDRAIARARAALHPLDADEMSRLLDFFERFAEHAHNDVEDAVVYKELRQNLGEAIAPPIDVMEREHDVARTYLKVARSAFQEIEKGDPRSHQRLEMALEAYCGLLRSRIEKEEHLFFPFAERFLPPERDLDLDQRLLAARRTKMDDAEHDRVIAAMQAPIAADGAHLDARSLDRGMLEAAHPETMETALLGRTLYEDGGYINALCRLQPWAGGAVEPVPDRMGRGDDFWRPQDLSRRAGRRFLPGARSLHLLLPPRSDIGTCQRLAADTPAQAVISTLWARFIPHFAVERLLLHRLKTIPDAGLRLDLGGTELLILPAHFLHSPGNFHVYDPVSKILFSGDLGASIGTDQRSVQDFEQHIPRMLAFHKRYMASGKALKAWVAMARTLDVQTIAPQHGAILEGPELVARFYEWCETLDCGVDLLQGYSVPEPAPASGALAPAAG
jgi:hemerythrin-like domain-containing protein